MDVPAGHTKMGAILVLLCRPGTSATYQHSTLYLEYTGDPN